MGVNELEARRLKEKDIGIDGLKARRLKEKREEYGDWQSWSLCSIVEHFFAEVGKLQHQYFHNEPWGHAFADVSNLHDEILKRLRTGK
mgnify:CR=1 FL=1